MSSQKIKRLLAGLNPEQRAAASRVEGPVLVLAGAGTGKTSVVTTRIAVLLASGVEPSGILAVTFTNKAAGEMRARVAELVGHERARELTVGTFHAFCVRAIREHAETLGLARGFAIADSSDQISVVRAAVRELALPDGEIHPREIQSRISLWKSRMIGHDAAARGAASNREATITDIYERYDQILARMRLVDFDDLLLLAHRLLNENRAILAAMRARYVRIMVDEFQDTNPPQYEIVRLLSSEHRNLFVVGDDDQSIYGWRGADVQKILGFTHNFPEALVVRLETNYRSTTQILEAANRVIVINPDRHEKSLRSYVGAGDATELIRAEDEEKEASQVIDAIVRAGRDDGAKLSDCAILFRTQSQPRAFEAELRLRRLPYVLVGGMSFFDRKEIRDVLAYMKLAVNPRDEVALLRALGAPPRGVGKTTIERALEIATKARAPLLDVFQDAAHAAALPAAAVAAVRDLVAVLERASASIKKRGLPLAIEDLIAATGYRREVDRCYDDPATREARWAGVLEILDFAENHARRTARADFATFLEELTLAATEESKDDKNETDRVTLMTLHAAKGLEFKRVWLVGLEEGIFPHHRAVAETGVEEERRLMYVGITRAMRHLCVTLASERSHHGRRIKSMPSRFLYEMTGRAPPEGWRACDAPVDAPSGKKIKKKAAKRRRKSQA